MPSRAGLLRHAATLPVPSTFPAHGAVPRTPFGRRLGNELLDRRGKSPALIRLYRLSPRCTPVGLPNDPGAADVHRLLRLRSSCCGLQARRGEPPERWVREAAAAVAASPFFRCRRNGCSTSTSSSSSLGAANLSFS